MEAGLNSLSPIFSQYYAVLNAAGIQYLSEGLAERLQGSGISRDAIIEVYQGLLQDAAPVAWCGFEVSLYRLDGNDFVVFAADGDVPPAMDEAGALDLLLDIARNTRNVLLVLEEGRVIFSSDRIRDITGYCSEELMGRLFIDFIPAQFREDFVYTCMHEIPRETSGWMGRELMLSGKTGRRVDISFNGGWHPSGDKKLLWLVVADISTEKKTERRLRDLEKEFIEIYERAPVGFLHVSPRGRIMDCNDFICNLVGYPKDEIRNSDFSLFVPPHEVEDLREDFRRLYTAGDEISGRECLLRTSAGNRITVEYSAKIVVRKGHKTGALMMLIDKTRQKALELELLEKNAQMEKTLWEMAEVNDALEIRSGELNQATEELKMLNEKLELLSITDGLTELYNHRHFQDRLSEEIARVERQQHGFVSLGILDIDDFKKFNDTYGHQCGDEVLKMLAVTLKATVREIDIIARYGGEEFAVIFPDTDTDEAAIVAERVCEAVRSMPVRVHDGTELKVTASIGVGTLKHGENDKAELVRRADSALYVAKAQWKDCVEVWAPEDDMR